jgi:hypothetical protein
MVGEQHLYVSFRTAAPGLDLPPHLQNQFWGLAVEDESFSREVLFD